MFANATNVRISQQVVATLAACATVLASIGYFSTVQAASIPSISNTLSDSAPEASPSHTIEFTVPTGSSIASGDNIRVTFDSTIADGTGGQDFAGDNGNNIGNAIDVATDVDFGVNAPAGTNATPVAEDANSFTFNGVTASAGDVVEIVVAEGVIQNPSKVNPAGTGDSYEIEVFIDNTGQDLGNTRVVIIDTVTVSAIVDTIFEFSITGLATSTTVNGTTTTGGATATDIDFEELTANATEVIGQQLNVSTNADNGFVVTVETDGDLEAGNGAIIDTFSDGTDVSTPAAWAPPSNNISDELTWGHWGVTSADDDYGSTDYIAASTTPRQLFAHNGPSDGVTDDIGSTSVAYAIEISPLQEAADDYTAVLTYIATPTF